MEGLQLVGRILALLAVGLAAINAIDVVQIVRSDAATTQSGRLGGDIAWAVVLAIAAIVFWNLVAAVLAGGVRRIAPAPPLARQVGGAGTVRRIGIAVGPVAHAPAVVHRLPPAPPQRPVPAGYALIGATARTAGLCGACFQPVGRLDLRHAVRGCGQPIHEACLAATNGACPGPCGMAARYG